MNITDNKHRETEIDYIGILINWVSQWKAILVVAIITALIIPGLKLYKDNKDYKAELQRAKQAENNGEVLSAENAEEILESFSEIDRAPIEVLLQQHDWVRSQKEYLDNSLLMNTDPMNQRTLFIPVLIADCESSIMLSLYKSYLLLLYDQEFIDALGKGIGIDKGQQYIRELISIDANEKESELLKDSTSYVFGVSIILPKDADQQAVEEAVKSAISERSSKLNKSIGAHTIRFLDTELMNCYNDTAVSKKTTAMYTINNLQQSIKTNTALISGEQQTALKTIEQIKNKDISGSRSDAESEAIKAPSFSKKYLILGAIAGIMLYSFVFAMRVLLRKRINSRKDVEKCATGRLLGEVYCPFEAKKLGFLFKSKLVDSIRLRGKDDPNNQIEKAVASISALCQHINTKTVTMFTIIKREEGINSIINRIADALKQNNIESIITNVTEDITDNAVLTVDNAVCIISKEGRLQDVCKIDDLLEVYDVKKLGNIYIGDMY